MPQVEKTLKLLVFVIIAFVHNRSIAVVDRLRNSGSLKEQAEDRLRNSGSLKEQLDRLRNSGSLKEQWIA